MVPLRYLRYLPGFSRQLGRKSRGLSSTANGMLQLGISDPRRRDKGPFVIGVAGASASGKTSVCNQLIRSLNHHRCLLMSMDWFYHGVPEDSAEEEYNFDHPDALDFQSIKTTMQLMLDKKPVEVPIYDYKLVGCYASEYPDLCDMCYSALRSNCSSVSLPLLWFAAQTTLSQALAGLCRRSYCRRNLRVLLPGNTRFDAHESVR
mmetsp:Transcript_43726/g.171096  ORF Transcript_43726/g.171096 Transcript_43726/m.171096 type:complete len:205 (+) Transcript_43726:525-1139(+)